MENYLRYKMVGGKIILKDHVVPHIFSCQADRKRALETSERVCAIKRARKNLVSTLLQEGEASGEATAETSETFMEQGFMESETEAAQIAPTSLKSAANEEYKSKPSTCKYTQTDDNSVISGKQRTVSVQYRPYYRSKHVQTELLNFTTAVSVACSPFKVTKLVYIPSPSKVSDVYSDVSSGKDSNYSSIFESDSTITLNSDTSGSSRTLRDNIEADRIKSISVERSKYLALHKSRYYLGLPEDSHFIISLLQRYSTCSLTEIYITLKKIRIDLPFQHIGDDFGISSSQAAKIFQKCVPRLSVFLRKLIFWPPAKTIKKCLPIAFRANYSDVQSIIDCFEIEVEKPSDPVKQALTWSEYKKSNTMKYLISSTPDGVINFISNGFGGRTSDVKIVEKSEYLTVLRKNCSVMADRGFKRIDVLLQPLGCSLKRPPSVEAGIKSTKEEVLETKRIAALRIHIERVIRRIREFKLLKPHSCINNKTIKYLDHVVIIVCALVNLQSSIIRI